MTGLLSNLKAKMWENCPKPTMPLLCFSGRNVKRDKPRVKKNLGPTRSSSFVTDAPYRCFCAKRCMEGGEHGAEDRMFTSIENLVPSERTDYSSVGSSVVHGPVIHSLRSARSRVVCDFGNCYASIRLCPRARALISSRLVFHNPWPFNSSS